MIPLIYRGVKLTSIEAEQKAFKLCGVLLWLLVVAVEM
jgi:hypothetical protein